jgi:hypothetical protein
MFIRLAEAVGGGIVVVGAGTYFAFQAAAPDLVKDLGLPVGFLVLVIGALRILWRANEKKDEKIEAMTLRSEERAKEFAEAVRAMAADQKAVVDKFIAELEQRPRRARP